MAPPHGGGPLAAGDVCLLLIPRRCATPARPADPVPGRQGGRGQDHVRGGARAGGAAGREDGPAGLHRPGPLDVGHPRDAARFVGAGDPARADRDRAGRRDARPGAIWTKRRRGWPALFRPAVVREAARQIELTASMPGVADVAVFDRMSDLIVSRAGTYDLVVFDTAPTGHALRLLRMPELMSSWIDALARRRREAVEAPGAGGGRGRRRGSRRPGARDPRVAHVPPARGARGADARRSRRVRPGPDPGAAADRRVRAGGARTVGGRDVVWAPSS